MLIEKFKIDNREIQINQYTRIQIFEYLNWNKIIWNFK